MQLGRHDLERIARASLVVASPGVPPDAPPFVAARKAGVDIVSEIEIGLRFLPGSSYIAITGTNGKTTTTALIGHLLKALGRHASTAGNIGTPLTELALSAYAAGMGRARGLVVPAARHAEHRPARRRADESLGEPSRPVHSVEEYFADKALLFRNAGPGSHWVTNLDDAAVQEMTQRVPGVTAASRCGSAATRSSIGNRCSWCLVSR